MSNRVLLPPKRQGESVLYSQFDFLSLYASATDAITLINSVTASVYSGIDANPNAIVGPLSFSGSVVSAMFQNGVLGVIYEVKASVTLLSGQTPILCGYLAIIPDLP